MSPSGRTLRRQAAGDKFYVAYLQEANGSCQVADYLEDVRRNDSASATALEVLLQNHAEIGPITDTRRSRQIKEHDNLWEFKKKAKKYRLAYFYLGRGITVIAYGFDKVNKPAAVFDKAARIRDEFLAALPGEGKNIERPDRPTPLVRREPPRHRGKRPR